MHWSEPHDDTPVPNDPADPAWDRLQPQTGPERLPGGPPGPGWRQVDGEWFYSSAWL